MSSVFTPRPYQDLIINHEIDILRCNIWAGMGMGKTVATLTTLEDLFMAGAETQPALVLAPLRVAASTWPDEAVKWGHLRNIEVKPIVGNAKARAAALANSNASVFTINYDNLVWLVEELGGRWPFGTVIADESTRLKGHRTKGGGRRAAALAKVAHSGTHRWVNLTGTPAPNGLLDLWGQSWFVDQGQRLGRTFTGFKDRWFQSLIVKQDPKDHGRVLVKPLPYAQEQIQERLKDITISLDAADWFDIRKPIENTIPVKLPAKAWKHYRDMEKEMFTQLETGDVEVFNAASKTMKCLQIASGAVYTDDAGSWSDLHDAKLQALDSILTEAAGAPVLVAYHWKHDLERLLKAFPRGRHLDQDPQTLRDWNAGKIPVLFAHPASAGHGLNMQDGGNILVFFSHWWDLEQYQQIIERIGPTRQIQAGHNRPVFIHHIIAADTMDEMVMERRNSKRTVQDILLDAMKKRGVL
ncbi:TPA: DEAD/DEAH box helicase [Escherichia coli]|uniref:DEAD/DEAH box helicase n=1 Tax=Escherichia coli TaxID=562 RepID=UPI00301BC81C|nr:DEAD/DEAH box helicase [Escherichia coli]HAX7483473.1 DEAD/DEAH box helicase [Escherichia coli]